MAVSPGSSNGGWYERIDVLRRRRGIMLGTFALVAAIYIPFVAAMPNLYRASTKVIVEGQADSSVAQTTPGEVNARLQAIKQLAFSRTQLTQLADRFHLYEDSIDSGSSDQRLERVQRDIRFDVIDDQAGGRPTAIAFQLSYLGTDPATAAAVANALASFYAAQNDRMKVRGATRASEVLGRQLADARRKLEDQDGRLQAYTAANPSVLPQQMSANLASLERLNVQLRLNGEAQMRLLERRQSLQNQIAELQNKPVVPNDNDPSVRLALLRKQLADLKTRWTDIAPDVKDLQQQIDALERQKAAVAAPRDTAGQASPRSTLEAALAETNTQLQRLGQEGEALRGNIKDVEARVDSAPVRSQQFQGLYRDDQVTRDMYDSLLKRYNDATLAEKAEAGSTEEFRVLDAAIPPAGPAGPNRRTLLLLGLLLCVVAAVGAARFAERLDTSFRTLDDLRGFTRVPVLASIPNISTAQDRLSSHLRAAAWAGASAVTIAMLAFAAFRFGRGAEPVVRMLMRLG